jgi:hypothetical protein
MIPLHHALRIWQSTNNPFYKYLLYRVIRNLARKTSKSFLFIGKQYYSAVPVMCKKAAVCCSSQHAAGFSVFLGKR